MKIMYPNLQICWHNPNRGICGIIECLPEIEKKKYAYDLQGGQTVYFLGYIAPGAPYTYHVHIKDVTAAGVTVDNWMFKDGGKRIQNRNCFKDYMRPDGNAFLPWEIFDEDTGKNYNLIVEPLPYLHDKLKIQDLISGKYEYYTDQYGTGIWYRHGGWRSRTAEHEENIKHIEKNGQISIEDMIQGGRMKRKRMNVEQAAEILNMPILFLRDLIESGRAPFAECYKRPGSSKRTFWINEEALYEYKRKGKQ